MKPWDLEKVLDAYRTQSNAGKIDLPAVYRFLSVPSTTDEKKVEKTAVKT